MEGRFGISAFRVFRGCFPTRRDPRRASRPRSRRDAQETAGGDNPSRGLVPCALRLLGHQGHLRRTSQSAALRANLRSVYLQPSQGFRFIGIQKAHHAQPRQQFSRERGLPRAIAAAENAEDRIHAAFLARIRPIRNDGSPTFGRRWHRQNIASRCSQPASPKTHARPAAEIAASTLVPSTQPSVSRAVKAAKFPVSTHSA